MRDTRIYDKYLNMKPKEKKKIDFRIRFDSKEQRIGVIIFAVGLLVLSLGFILMFINKYDDKVVPEKPEVLKNVNVKDFDMITTSDGLVKLDKTTITFDREKGLSEMNLVISSEQSVEKFPFKIIFKLNGEDVVIADYLEGLEPGYPYELFKQSSYDLTEATSWSIEMTTMEDLEANYGMVF